MQLQSNVTRNGSEFMKETQETLDLAVGFGPKNVSHTIPKIIYASRTHSQLSQAVNELKATSYKPKISVLGSRDQMCINHDVTKLEDNNAKVYACRVKISSRSCMYYNNVEANKSNKDFKNEILDIEDICRLGNKHSVCPYFMSRELRTDADLIFMPYNYVLDFKLRQTNSVDLQNAIILLDEAHNVEKTCEEAASFELSTYDLANAQADCDECHKILKEQSVLLSGFDEGSSTASAISQEDTMKLKDIFNKIEKVVMQPVLTPENPKKVADSEFLYDALMKQNINASSFRSIIDAIEQCNTLLASQANLGFKRKHFALPKISEILKTLFCQCETPRNLNFETGRFYKVVIRQEQMKVQHRNQIDIWNQKSKDLTGKANRTLNYWCFHAGVSMKEIMRQGTRSLILTSGTLSPIESFMSEFDIPFPVTLQNPHVIGSSQIWAGIITQGPDGVELNSSYQKRSTLEYQKSLGSLLVILSRSMPHGLLVFFPSYVLMDEMIKNWDGNGILERITRTKPYFAEPRDKRNLGTQMEMFYEKINDPEYKGAIFFAVCRGKVSEGLDFADKNGRVVVITGLPYPPKMDAKVELKMRFLDGKVGAGTLSGSQWYSQQASRAVNQAVGRVIRHNKDYGAILLCDVRFSYPDSIGRLPIWIRKHVKKYDDFGVAHRNLILFFKNVESMFSPRKEKEIDQHHGKASGYDLFGSKKSLLESKSSLRQKLAAKRTADLPVSVFNSRATNSLAAIKAEEGPAVRANLLQSLWDSNSKQEKSDCHEDRNRISSIIVGSGGDSMKSSKKSKKLRLVSKKAGEALKVQNGETKRLEECNDASTSMDNTARLKLDTQEKEGHDESRGGKNVSNAKQYILTLRSKLSKEDYDKFAKILLNYTKKEDMLSLIENLTQLFEEKPDHIHLFKGFESFIKREKDKKAFDEAYDRLVSRVSGKEKDRQKTINIHAAAKKEVSCSNTDSRVITTEPALKKQKMSEPSKMESQVKLPISEFFPSLSDDDSDDETHKNKARCIICINDVTTPYKAPCGHLACGKCWYYTLKNDNKCPKCKMLVNQRKLVKV